jgi:hypothetical protein
VSFTGVAVHVSSSTDNSPRVTMDSQPQSHALNSAFTVVRRERIGFSTLKAFGVLFLHDTGRACMRAGV